MAAGETNERTATPAVRFRQIAKHFGGTTAVDSVSLDIRRGSVHALIGENGAGKSTLLGVLAGRLAASSGDVEIFGVPLQTGDVRAARLAGVVAIYQELTIVPDLSACANVFLGQVKSRYGFLSERDMRARFIELCRHLGVSIEPDARAGTLSIADQQIVEILRALQSDAKVLLLDEPTSALAPPERRALYRQIAELRASGVTVVLVSHNLDEVLENADEVSVFRDGRLIHTAPAAEWTKASLVSAMLGHGAHTIRRQETVHDAGAIADAEASALLSHKLVHGSTFSGDNPLLRVEGVSIPGKLDDVAIAVRPGEIVGIGGLVGSGRTTLLRALAGLEPSVSGRIWIDGVEKRWPLTPAQALALGIALIPEDRKQGLVLGRAAEENVVLADLPSVATAGFLSERRMRNSASAAAGRCGFDRARLGAQVGSLSGGNQQKLLLARWLHRPPRVLLADEPTRGIDVGAKEEILQKLRELTESGLAILFVSSELEEVVALSDRIVVLAAGRDAGTIEGNTSVADVLGAAFALTPAHV